MHYKILTLLVLVLQFASSVMASGLKTGSEPVDSTLINIEVQINDLAEQLYNTRSNDDLSQAISDSILNLLKQAYTNPKAFDYPFPSLKAIGKIESDKNEVRIFTWNIVLRTGEYKYYGFIHYNDEGIQKYFVLNDASNTLADDMSATLNADSWFGANYYELLERKNTQGTHYILLGWHGHNLHLNKKVIETLYFTESGKPKFGKSLLKVQQKKYKRIVFQYSRMVDMLLSYDLNMDMIVMDHLSPPSSVEVGDYQFYGPDLSYDGLAYNGEFWEYKETIDFKRIEEKKRKNRK